MKSRFFPTLLLLFTVVALGATGRAADSLFNAKNAKPAAADLRSVLGPKSAGIRYDKRMIRAAQIAAARAHKHSTSRCWRSVKNALLAAEVVTTRPATEYAKQAAVELQTKFGFTKLNIRNPFAAPIGSVLVYGGKGAGHVEIRTAKGFASDFTTTRPSSRPLIGVYVKRS